MQKKCYLLKNLGSLESAENKDKLRDLSLEGFKKMESDCKTFEKKAKNLITKYSDDAILEGTT